MEKLKGLFASIIENLKWIKTKLDRFQSLSPKTRLTVGTENFIFIDFMNSTNFENFSNFVICWKWILLIWRIFRMWLNLQIYLNFMSSCKSYESNNDLY